MPVAARAKIERILEAAMEMVAEGGFDALSMARLADAVDYTPGALYRYFRSKDALYAALVSQVIGQGERAGGGGPLVDPGGAPPRAAACWWSRPTGSSPSASRTASGCSR